MVLERLIPKGVLLAALNLLAASSSCSVYDESLLDPASGNGTGGDGQVSTGSGGASGSNSASESNTTGQPSTGGGKSNTGGGDTTSDGSTGGTAGQGSGGGASSGGTESAGGAASSGGAESAGGASTSGTGGGSGGSDSTSTAGSGGSTACSDADCCPDDPDKTQPGTCGCGVPDDDSDQDGSADCVDECPDDPDKSAPGECGCGVHDEDTAQAAGCLGLKNSLVHRYSFGGTGTKATDSQGTQHGTVIGTRLDGSGSLTLASGDSEQYVELPAKLISTLESVTLEAWFSWGGDSSDWQRVFDFGSTKEGIAGKRGMGLTYLFFTPRASSNEPRAIFSEDGFAGEVVCTGSSLATSTSYHVMVSLDTKNATFTLYIDGALQAAQAFTGSLAGIDDVNNWLGRSQYAADAQFVGAIDEFRIYDQALDSAQAAFSYAAGPDPAFLDN